MVVSFWMTTLTAEEPGPKRYTDINEAGEAAKAENKALFLYVIESEVSEPSRKFAQVILSSKLFASSMADEFVLMEVDIPKDASGMSEDRRDQTMRLMRTLGIDILPTIVLVDQEGRPYVYMGYEGEDLIPFIAKLKVNQTKLHTRDAAWKQAADTQGLERAKALSKALRAIEIPEEHFLDLYSKEIEEFKAADTQDETGYLPVIQEIEQFVSLKKEVDDLLLYQGWREAVECLDKGLAETAFSAKHKQLLLRAKAKLLAQSEDFDLVMETYRLAKEANPSGDLVKVIEREEKILRERFNR